MALDAVLIDESLARHPDAAALIGDLRDRGLKTVLLTDDNPSHRDDERFDAVADDLAAALVQLDGWGFSPAQAMRLVETVPAAQSCRTAGLVCLALGSGDEHITALRSAGARRVWPDLKALMDDLDDALALASPGPAHLTRALIESLMRAALTEAERGMADGEAPIGCVLARGDGSILARGFNEMNRSQNKTAHAEIVTFARAAGKVPLDARDLILVSTLEPCVMCTGAAMEAAVETIVYALQAPADNGTGRVAAPVSPEAQMPRIVGPVLAAESRVLFERFVELHGPDKSAYVTQLLALTADE